LALILGVLVLSRLWHRQARFWEPRKDGYAVDARVCHAGERSVRLGTSGGLAQEVLLNQLEPEPIRVTLWSRSSEVNPEASAAVEVWAFPYDPQGIPSGWVINLPTGTTEWTQYETLVAAEHPIQRLLIQAYFVGVRGHIWLDEVEAFAPSDPEWNIVLNSSFEEVVWGR